MRINKISCSGCEYAHFQDHGGNNHSVRGTTFSCMRGIHPAGSFERYCKGIPEPNELLELQEAHKLRYAKECPSYVAGDPIDMDVNRENEEYLTEKQHQLLKVWKVVKLLSS